MSAVRCTLLYVGRSQHARAVVFGTFDSAFSPLFACLFQSVVIVSFKSVFVVFIFQVSCELLGFRSKNKNIKINTVFLDVLTAVGTLPVSFALPHSTAHHATGPFVTTHYF